MLILEDNVDAAQSLSAALRLSAPEHEYQTFVAARLEEAERIVRRQRVDIALVDLSLPDADGIEAASRLRAIAPNLPLVAWTGRRFEEIALDLIRLGVQDVVQKGTASIERIHHVLQLAAERHRHAAGLRKQACYDALTGLLNRCESLRHLEMAVGHADRSGTRGALLMLDIDNFKTINDTYGHLAGDAVLVDLASRLRRVARIGDTVGRLGGDEFIVVVEGIRDRDAAASAAIRASEASCYELHYRHERIRVSATIGVSRFPDDGTTATGLIERADRALYRAKSHGRGTFSLSGEAASARGQRR